MCSSDLDRLSPMISGLSTLCFVHGQGFESSQRQSFVNKAEATGIVELVATLIDQGVPGHDIGVIALCDLFISSFLT